MLSGISTTSSPDAGLIGFSAAGTAGVLGVGTVVHGVSRKLQFDRLADTARTTGDVLAAEAHPSAPSGATAARWNDTADRVERGVRAIDGLPTGARPVVAAQLRTAARLAERGDVAAGVAQLRTVASEAHALGARLPFGTARAVGAAALFGVAVAGMAASHPDF